MRDDVLVDAFADACLRAGRSNSGLCFSALAEADWEQMQKLRARLKARLAELTQQLQEQQQEGGR